MSVVFSGYTPVSSTIKSVVFSGYTPVSSTIKTDRQDIIEILLKVALNTITITHPLQRKLAMSYILPWQFDWMNIYIRRSLTFSTEIQHYMVVILLLFRKLSYYLVSLILPLHFQYKFLFLLSHIWVKNRLPIFRISNLDYSKIIRFTGVFFPLGGQECPHSYNVHILSTVCSKF